MKVAEAEQRPGKDCIAVWQFVDVLFELQKKRIRQQDPNIPILRRGAFSGQVLECMEAILSLCLAERMFR